MNSTNKENITVLQWNTLCSTLSTEKSFPYIKPEFLEWKYRYPLIKSILESCQADVLCLEEIDNFPEYSEQIITPLNKYKTIFSLKNDGFMGCCIAYDESKLKYISHDNLTLYQNVHNEKSNQIAVIAYFETNNKNKLCVICTHLKAKYVNEEIRVHQIRCLLEYIKEKELKANCDCVVLCGDFNTEPNCTSVGPMYSEFTSVFEYKDMNSQRYQEYTTKKKRDCLYKRVIDYIWYWSSEKTEMKLLSQQTPFYKHDEEIGFPNEVFPSDHYFIKASFEI